MEAKLFNEALNELKTVGDIVRFAASQFMAAKLHFGHGTDNAWDEAVAIVLPALHLPLDSKSDVLYCYLTHSERHMLLELISIRISKRIPAAYITKQAWFAGLPFFVDERVLIPRSPIAELIDQAFAPWIEIENIHNILDLCTGSGCIAVACAVNLLDVDIDAVDVSPDAIAVADINIHTHRVHNRIKLIKSDLFSALKGKEYDVIISNPPYVDAIDMKQLPEEYRHEPRMALAAGHDGLDIVRRILREAKDYLTPEGILIVEVGNSAKALMDTFPNVPFTWLEFSSGDSDVFLLTKKELQKYKSEFGA